MALAFPYTYISCPCSDASRQAVLSQRASRDVDLDAELQEDDKTFDPRHPRSAFSLFPPEHLLYCEECHDIKCPRCVTEEVICYYCPSCLFETPTSMVKSEGNRCARNCFNCPICTTQLVTAPLGEGKEGPYVLNCTYCMWTTLDIGIKFEKPTNIRGQLDRMANGGKPKAPSRAGDSIDPSRKSSLAREPFSPADLKNDSDPMEKAQPVQSLDPHSRFNALKAFYKEQIRMTSPDVTGVPSSALDLAYGSPSSIARIMNLYTNIGGGQKKSTTKPSVMREALNISEGLQISSSQPKEIATDYSDTASLCQRSFQHPLYLGNPNATSVSEIRPMPSLLRTKRSKRCAACKHILVKPEFKPTSTRYRIKLVALNYIPFINLKPVPVSGGLRQQGPDGGDVVLTPGKPSQWIMTLKNPLFDNVTVGLGSPSITPGRHGHKVTILCPQFEIGKTGDVWDDALNNPLNKTVSPSGGEQIAGKLYDQGRNWASVVFEIVPAFILREGGRDLEEDEDVVEVPIRVRLEWKVTDEEGGEGRKRSEKVLEEGAEVDDGKRELSYWMVLGVGRVAC